MEFDEFCCYEYLTMTTWRKRKVFLDGDVNDVLERALAFHIEENHIAIAGYVILPDHVHILAYPANWPLPKFVTSFKTYSGGKVKLAGSFTGGVWRRRYFSEPVLSYDELGETLKKMHDNPVRDGLVKKAVDYPWSSAAAYAGEKPRIPIKIEHRGKKL